LAGEDSEVKFIDDWHKQFPKLWSVRFALLAALASAIETGMNLYATGTAPILVVATGLSSIGAAIARIVAQPSVTGNG
jgi:hypothetical protein